MKPILSAINAQFSRLVETDSDDVNLAFAASCVLSMKNSNYDDQLHMSICFDKIFHVKYRSNKVIWKFLHPSVILESNTYTVYELNK